MPAGNVISWLCRSFLHHSIYLQGKCINIVQTVTSRLRQSSQFSMVRTIASAMGTFSWIILPINIYSNSVANHQQNMPVEHQTQTELFLQKYTFCKKNIWLSWEQIIIYVRKHREEVESDTHHARRQLDRIYHSQLWSQLTDGDWFDNKQQIWQEHLNF